MSNSFSMYRPVSRLSSAVSGYIAGMPNMSQKVRDNVKARIKMAIDEIGIATKEKNDKLLQGATLRKELLIALLQGKELSHQDQVFCGLVVEGSTTTTEITAVA